MGDAHVEMFGGKPDPPRTMPPGHEQELVSGVDGLSGSLVEVAPSGDVIPGEVGTGGPQTESLGHVIPPMTIPPGHEQELISEGLGLCGSDNFPPGLTVLMPGGGGGAGGGSGAMPGTPMRPSRTLKEAEQAAIKAELDVLDRVARQPTLSGV